MKNIFIITFAIAIVGCTQTSSHKVKALKDVVENKYEDRIDTVSMLFLGDIMGHDSQIRAAYDSSSNRYNYHSVFKKISPFLKSADFTIGNLEVTLAGEPYKGYPRFSSPDALALACKNNGINIFVTANNHSNDRKTEGIIRTINILDSLKIDHTGTFRDSLERANSNLLILTKNSIRVGILNYTYGTNSKADDSPAIVNKIDTSIMLNDITLSKADSLDKLIAVLHWGKEYMSKPNDFQKSMAQFLFKNGVDIIIGSHPHVIQPMAYFAKTDSTEENFIAYSLGNFVSNQTSTLNGGAVVAINLIKKNGKTCIDKQGYYLTWVNKHKDSGKKYFEVILVDKQIINTDSSDMASFINNARKLLEKENKQVTELSFN